MSGELIELNKSDYELCDTKSAVAYYEYVGIFEEYIRDSLNQNFGSFFEVEIIFDSLKGRVCALMTRENITLKKFFSLRGAYKAIKAEIDGFMQRAPSEWNSLISEHCIRREKIYTQCKLVNPYFVPAANFIDFHAKRLEERKKQIEQGAMIENDDD